MPRFTAATLAAFLLLTATAQAADVPEGAVWEEATITVADGTRLHADVLRPKDLPKDARTPVILSIGPYFNHSGQVGVVGPVQGEDLDPVGPSTGPSARFHDLIEGGRLMERGYTFVMVDNRGFGGSSGCLDWAGPGEQADVKAAVEWAAQQPWSTGRVGMYGKSYDGVTGLIGAQVKPKGLAAVVSQEPVYDMYRYLFSNGVRYANSAGTPALYDAIAATPGPLLDDPAYNVNGLTTPDCLATNYLAQQDGNHGSAYWKARDFIRGAREAKAPLLLTQGFLENNTKPDGAFEYYENYGGPKRAWFGMWDHVRGNDKDDEGRLLMGREGWFDEVMRFFDHHVREVPLADAPVDKDPAVVVQTSDGTWRAEQAWPPADAKALSVPLKPGSYVDDAQNNGSGAGSGVGVWTFSPPLADDAWFAGVPRVKAKVAAPVFGNTAGAAPNFTANVYDVAPDGKAILVSRGTTLLNGPEVDLELLGNDWKFPAGHRVGVLLSSSNAEWWLPLPTLQTVTIESASAALPWLGERRDETLPGARSVRLEEWLEEAPFQVEQATIDGATDPAFPLPAALRERKAPAPAAAPAKPSSTAKDRIKVRTAVRRGKRPTLVAYGNAPTGAKLTIGLRRGDRRIAVRRVTARVGAFRTTFRIGRTARYRVTVSATVGGTRLSARTPLRKVTVRR